MIIDMLLFCPRCGAQHVDKPDVSKAWDNPPHASHTCAKCELVWRPSNANTNGVERLSVLEPHHKERIVAAYPSSWRPSPCVTDHRYVAPDCHVSGCHYLKLQQRKHGG